jgi:flagellar biosynthesis/type III secretory pathway protein FliH
VNGNSGGGTPSVDTPSPPKIHSPEVAAAEEYRARIAVQEANEKVLEALKDEARAAGYRDGFKLGEEKAELQSRNSAQTLFGHVAELISEFEALKHSVLVGAQHNFYELAQAMGEALLGKEFSIRPESFAAVIRKAIDETVESDSFKVRVHPETFEKLANLDLPDLKKRLVKDPSLGIDHFRIESHLTAVDQNARKLIATLLEQADVDLFAGTDVKAG